MIKPLVLMKIGWLFDDGLVNSNLLLASIALFVLLGVSVYALFSSSMKPFQHTNVK